MSRPPSGAAVFRSAVNVQLATSVSPFCVRRQSACGHSCLPDSTRYILRDYAASSACLRPAGPQAQIGAHVSRPRLVAAGALPAPAIAASTASPDPWHTLAVLSTCAAVSQLLESYTKWGAILSAPLLALTAALAAAALGLLPAVSPVYDAVWRYLMPLAVALYLLDHDITSLARSGGQVLTSFLLGASTMFAGAWCAWKVLGAASLGPHGAQLACCLLASYIGGSVNFAAVATATELPKALMPAAVAADNLAMLVLLGAMMAAPARLIAALTAAAPVAAAAAGPSTSHTSSTPNKPPAPAITATAAARSSGPPNHPRAKVTALGLDGRPLLTEPPTADALAACMQASAKGKAVVSSNATSYRSSGSYKQHALSHRAVGQHALDGKPLLTPDTYAGSSSSSSADGNGRRSSPTVPLSAVAAAVAGDAQSPQAAASYSSHGSSSSNGSSHRGGSPVGGSRKCGGCPGSGVTALDENPLLTKAPAMGDAINTITAARDGSQRLRTPSPPGSSGSSSGDSDGETIDDGVVGCGGCEQALNAMAAASSSSPFSSSDRRSSSSQRSGALALDGGLLMTEEPEDDQHAVAVATAKAGGKAKSADVTVSGSALSTLASTDSDELELVVRFNWREFQNKVKREQQAQEAQRIQAALPGDWEKISVSSSVDSSDSEDTLVISAKGSGPAAISTAAVTAAAAATPALVSKIIAGSSSGSSSALTSSTGSAALAAAAVACAGGQALAAWLGAPALQLLLLSCCALGLSVAGNAAFTAVSKQQQQQHDGTSAVSASGPYAGASQLGQLLMGVFFATLGASCCCSWSSFLAAAPQFAFVIIMVIVHWALLAGIGRVLGPAGLNVVPLSSEVLLVGSAANVGGPATAAALANAKGWEGLVQPALLCGSLGYALGTAGGVLLARGLGVLAV